MKWLLLSCILISSCTRLTIPKPKYKFGQQVRYQVASFYSLVCSGKGVIKDFRAWNEIHYFIETPVEESNCPSPIEVKEKDVKEI